MGGRINLGDYHVDNISKDILVALYENHRRATRDSEVDPSMGTGELLDYCEMERYNKMSNRVSNHLGPAGLVADLSDDDDPYRYVLTDEGVTFVEDHGLDMPTRADVREVARAAQKTAESARESADEFRKEVSEVRTEAPTLTSLQNEFDDFRELIYIDGDSKNKTRMVANQTRINGLDADIGDLQSQIGDLEGEIDQTNGELEKLNNRLNNWDDRINEIEQKVEKAARKASNAEENAMAASATATDISRSHSPEPTRDESAEEYSPTPTTRDEGRSWPSIPTPSLNQIVLLIVLAVLASFAYFFWWPDFQQTFGPILP